MYTPSYIETADIDSREKIYVRHSELWYTYTSFQISRRHYLFAKRINPLIIYRSVQSVMLIEIIGDVLLQ